MRSGGSRAAAEEEGDEDGDEGEDGEVAAGEDLVEAPSGSGSELKLKPWAQRKRKSLGQPVNGRPAPLIDQVHALMHLWKAGDVQRVDEYIRGAALRQNRIFPPLLQALIELSPAGSEERATLESISNHLAGRGALMSVQGDIPFEAVR